MAKDSFYSWRTKKLKKGFRFDVQKITSRKTKNKKGMYADIKVAHTGVRPTRARAKAQAQRYVRFYHHKARKK